MSTILDEHPEIEIARPWTPEPKFFLGDDFSTTRPGDFESRYFGRKPGATRYGEKCTSYIEYPIAAQRIAGWYPDARIIFLLRDPIERAISNFHFSKQNGFETLPMEEAFAEEERRRDQYDHAKLSVSPFSYLKRGKYIDYIRSYGELFPRSKMIVLIYEEFVEQIDRIQDFYRALGVESGFIPTSLGARVNASRLTDEHITPELRSRLLGYFAPYKVALEEYLGREISVWSAQ